MTSTALPPSPLSQSVVFFWRACRCPWPIVLELASGKSTGIARRPLEAFWGRSSLCLIRHSDLSRHAFLTVMCYLRAGGCAACGRAFNFHRSRLTCSVRRNPKKNNTTRAAELGWLCWLNPDLPSILRMRYMGVSENRGPQYSTLNSRILIIRTPKGTPNIRKLPYSLKPARL